MHDIGLVNVKKTHNLLMKLHHKLNIFFFFPLLGHKLMNSGLESVIETYTQMQLGFKGFVCRLV